MKNDDFWTRYENQSLSRDTRKLMEETRTQELINLIPQYVWSTVGLFKEDKYKKETEQFYRYIRALNLLHPNYEYKYTKQLFDQLNIVGEVPEYYPIDLYAEIEYRNELPVMVSPDRKQWFTVGSVPSTHYRVLKEILENGYEYSVTFVGEKYKEVERASDDIINVMSKTRSAFQLRFREINPDYLKHHPDFTE